MSISSLFVVAALWAVPNGQKLASIENGELEGTTVMNGVTLIRVTDGATPVFESGGTYYLGVPSKVMRARMKTIVENPDDVPTTKFSLPGAVSLMSLPTTAYDVVVIAPPDHVEKWNSYATLRHEQFPDLTFEVVNTFDIYDEYPYPEWASANSLAADDDCRNAAESIHKYLRENARDKGVSYVILGSSWINAQELDAGGTWTNAPDTVVHYLDYTPMSITNSVPGIKAKPRYDIYLPSDMFYACLDINSAAKYPWTAQSTNDSEVVYSSIYYEDNSDYRKSLYDTGVDLIVSRQPLKPISTWTSVDDHTTKIWTQDELFDCFTQKLVRVATNYKGTGRIGLTYGTFGSTYTRGGALPADYEFYDDIPNLFSSERHSSIYQDTEVAVRHVLRNRIAQYRPVKAVDTLGDQAWTLGYATCSAASANFYATDHDYATADNHGWALGTGWMSLASLKTATGLILLNDVSMPCQTGWQDYTGKDSSGIVTCQPSMGEGGVDSPFGGCVASVNNTREGWSGGVDSDSLSYTLSHQITRAFCEENQDAGSTWLQTHLVYAGITETNQVSGTSVGNTGMWCLLEHTLYGDPLVKAPAMTENLATTGTIALDAGSTNAYMTASSTGDMTWSVDASVGADLRAARLKIMKDVSVSGTAFTAEDGVTGGVGGYVKFLGSAGTVTLNTTDRFYLGGVSNVSEIVVNGANAIIDCDNFATAPAKIVFNMEDGATNILRGVKTGVLANTAIEATGGTILFESSNLCGGTTISLDGTTVALGADPSTGGLVASGEPLNAIFSGAGTIQYQYGTKLLKEYTIADGSSIKEVELGTLAVGFLYGGTVGSSPTGWITSWSGEKFSDSSAVLGPEGFVNVVAAGNHPYGSVAAKKGFTIAFYADLAKCASDGDKVMLSVGQVNSGNQILLTAAEDKQVRLEVTGNGGASITGTTATNTTFDYPGDGYHLYIVELQNSTVSLSIDGGEKKSDSSATVSLSSGMQIGSQYGGLKSNGSATRVKALGMAFGGIEGYDAILTDDEKAELVAKYPARSYPLAVEVSCDFNVAGGNASVDKSADFAVGTYLGATKGDLVIEEGVTVNVPAIRLLNGSQASSYVTNYVYGTLNVTGTNETSNVYYDQNRANDQGLGDYLMAGVMMGHWGGSSVMNVYGTVDNTYGYWLINYDATLAQVLNIAGGHVKTKGISNYSTNASNADRACGNNGTINISEGGVLEVASWPQRPGALGTMPINIHEGTIKSYGDFVCPRPLTFASDEVETYDDDGNVSGTETVNSTNYVDCAGNSIAFSGAWEGTGTVVLKDSVGGGSIALLNTIADTVIVVFDSSLTGFGTLKNCESTYSIPSTVTRKTIWLDDLTETYTSSWSGTVYFCDLNGTIYQEIDDTNVFKPWSQVQIAYDNVDYDFIYHAPKGSATTEKWETLSNWSTLWTNGSETNFFQGISSGYSPHVPGTAYYVPVLIDGAELTDIALDSDGYRTVKVAEVEGWNFQMGIVNGAHVKIGQLDKLQGGSKFARVDATSRLTIESWGSKADGGSIDFYVAAPSGIVINAAYNRSTSVNYYFTGDGSVVYAGGITKATHLIKEVSYTLSGTSGNLTLKRKKVIDFGGSGTAQQVYSDAEGYCANAYEALKAGINHFTIDVDADGAYVTYVDYGTTPTDITLSNYLEAPDLSNTSYSYTLEAMWGYIATGTISTSVTLSDSGSMPAVKFTNGYSGYTTTFSSLSGSGTIVSATTTTQKFVIPSTSSYNGSVDLSAGSSLVGFGEAGSTSSSINVASGATANLKNGGSWTAAGPIAISGTLSCAGAATISGTYITGADNITVAGGYEKFVFTDDDGNVYQVLVAAKGSLSLFGYNGKYYESLEEAVEVAGENAITLYTNVESYTLASEQNLKLVLNGYTANILNCASFSEADGVTTYVGKTAAKVEYRINGQLVEESASESDTQVFHGWYEDTENSSETVSAYYGYFTDAVAKVGGVLYDNWTDALAAAESSGRTIVVIDSSSIPEGYYVNSSGNLAKSAASIGEGSSVQYFGSFTDAVKAANNGSEKVTLLADVSAVYTMSKGETLVLNPNGYSYTIEAPSGYTLNCAGAGSALTYTITANTSSITYWIDGVQATGYSPTEYSADDLPLALPTDIPVKAGYVFQGWYTDASCSGEKISKLPVGYSGNANLYGRYAFNREIININFCHGQTYGYLTSSASDQSTMMGDIPASAWNQISDSTSFTSSSSVLFNQSNTQKTSLFSYLPSTGATTSYSGTYYANIQGYYARKSSGGMGGRGGSSSSTTTYGTTNNVTALARYSGTSATSAATCDFLRGAFLAPNSTVLSATASSSSSGFSFMRTTYTYSFSYTNTISLANVPFEKYDLTLYFSALSSSYTSLSNLTVTSGSTSVGTKSAKWSTAGYTANAAADTAFTEGSDAWTITGVTGNQALTITGPAFGNGICALQIVDRTPKTYTITYYIDGVEQTDLASSYSDSDTTDTALATKPSKSGYKFDGWYTDSDCTFPATAVVAGDSGDKQFYGKWIEFGVDANVISINVAQSDTTQISTDQETLVGMIPSTYWSVIGQPSSGSASVSSGTMYNPHLGATATTNSLTAKAYCLNGSNWGYLGQSGKGDTNVPGSSFTYMTCFGSNRDRATKNNTYFEVSGVPFVKYDIYFYFSGATVGQSYSGVAVDFDYTNAYSVVALDTETITDSTDNKVVASDGSLYTSSLKTSWGDRTLTEPVLGSNVIKLSNVTTNAVKLGYISVGGGVCAVQIVEVEPTYVTVGEGTSVSIDDLADADGVILAGGTIDVGANGSVKKICKVVSGTSVTVKAGSKQYDAAYVKGGYLYAADYTTKNVISINVALANNRNNTSVSDSKMANETIGGLEGVRGSEWIDVITSNTSVNTTTNVDGLTIHMVAANNYGVGAKTVDGTPDNYRAAYLDDGGNGAIVEIGNIPYRNYDAIVYFASDDTNLRSFRPATLNGTATGTDDWGTNLLAEAALGVNALRVANLTAETLCITGGVKSTTARGGIAAVQLVENPTYDITYMVDGETASGFEPTFYLAGTSTALPALEERTGYTNTGWCRDADCLSPITEISASATGDMTLYVKYTAIKYPITYIVDGACASYSPATYTIEDAVELPAASKPFTTFSGWFTDEALETAAENIAVGTTGVKTFYGAFTDIYSETYTNGNADKATNVGNYNPKDAVTLAVPASDDLTPGTVIIVTNVYFAVDSTSSTVAEFVTIGGVTSSAKSIETEAYAEGVYLVNYAFPTGVEITVGASYAVTLLNGNSDVIDSTVRFKLAASGDASVLTVSSVTTGYSAISGVIGLVKSRAALVTVESGATKSAAEIASGSRVKLTGGTLDLSAAKLPIESFTLSENSTGTIKLPAGIEIPTVIAKAAALPASGAITYEVDGETITPYVTVENGMLVLRLAPVPLYSNGYDNGNTVSTLLGGTILNWTDEKFTDYALIRDSVSNYAAKVTSSTHPNGSLTGFDDEAAWSVMAVAKLAEVSGGVLWNIGGAAWSSGQTGIFLCRNSEGKIELRKYTSTGSTGITCPVQLVSDAAVNTTQYHSFILTFDGGKTEDETTTYTYSLYIDGALAGATNLESAITFSTGNGQIGSVYGGITYTDGAVGSGFNIDEVAIWTSDISAYVTSVAGQYPLWPKLGGVMLMAGTDGSWTDAALWENGVYAGAGEVTNRVSATTTVTVNRELSLERFVVETTDDAAEGAEAKFTVASGASLAIGETELGAPITIEPGIDLGTVSGTGAITIIATNANYTMGSDMRASLKTNETTIVAMGGESTGLKMDYSGSSISNFLPHLVFDGGVHSFGWKGNGGWFSSTGTTNNPTMLVINGATLNLTEQDLDGWNGAVNTSTVIKVGDGSALNLASYTGSMFFRGRLLLDPGSTMDFKNTATSTHKGGIFGGTASEETAQIYVASPTGTATTATITLNSGSTIKSLIATSGSDSHGMGVTVKDDAILETYPALEGSASIVKYGNGIWRHKGDLANCTGTITVNAGTFEIYTDGVATNNATFAGSGAVEKTGSGTLVVTKGKEGSITVKSGELVIPLVSGEVYYESGATMDGGTIKFIDADGTVLATGSRIYRKPNLTLYWSSGTYWASSGNSAVFNTAADGTGTTLEPAEGDTLVIPAKSDTLYFGDKATNFVLNVAGDIAVGYASDTASSLKDVELNVTSGATVTFNTWNEAYQPIISGSSVLTNGTVAFAKSLTLTVENTAKFDPAIIAIPDEWTALVSNVTETAVVYSLYDSRSELPRVINVNISQDDVGAVTNTQATLVGDIPASAWLNTKTVNSSSNGTILYSMDETTAAAGATVTVYATSAANYGRTDTATPDYMITYCGVKDDTDKTSSITVTDIPFDKYDLYLYLSGHEVTNQTSLTEDTIANVNSSTSYYTNTNALRAVAVNGYWYTGDMTTGATLKGAACTDFASDTTMFTTWGVRESAEVGEGTNVLHITGLIGELSVQYLAGGQGVAAFQIVEHPVNYLEIDENDSYTEAEVLAGGYEGVILKGGTLDLSAATLPSSLILSGDSTGGTFKFADSISADETLVMYAGAVPSGTVSYYAGETAFTPGCAEIADGILRLAKYPAPFCWFDFESVPSASSNKGTGSVAVGGETGSESNLITINRSTSDKALVTVSGSVHPWGGTDLTQGASFTLAVGLRSVTTADSTLVSFGNGNTPQVIGLFADGVNGVYVGEIASGSTSPTKVFSATVEHAAEVFHYYVLTVDKDTMTATLYVDGVKKGSGTLSVWPNSGYQLGSIFGNGTAGGAVRTGGIALEDFKVFSGILDATQIKNATDEFAVYPTVVTVPAGETYNASAYSGDYVLAGAGTFTLTNFPSSVSAVPFILCSEWTGTVVLPAVQSFNEWNKIVNACGNANSTVKVMGIAGGYMSESGSVVPTLELGGEVKITNGYSGNDSYGVARTNTIARLTGSGTFTIGWSTTGELPFIVGEVADFSGAISNTSAANIKFEIQKFVVTSEPAAGDKLLAIGGTNYKTVSIASVVKDGAALDLKLTTKSDGIYVALPDLVDSDEVPVGYVDDDGNAIITNLTGKAIAVTADTTFKVYYGTLEITGAFDASASLSGETLTLVLSETGSVTVDSVAIPVVPELNLAVAAPFAISEATDDTDGATLVVKTIPGLWYAVKYADTLAGLAASDVATTTYVQATTASTPLTAPTGSSTTRFYRIVVTHVQ